MAGPKCALILRLKGQRQGHRVIKFATGMGLQVDTTAHFAHLFCCYVLCERLKTIS